MNMPKEVNEYLQILGLKGRFHGVFKVLPQYLSGETEDSSSHYEPKV